MGVRRVSYCFFFFLQLNRGWYRVQTRVDQLSQRIRNGELEISIIIDNDPPPMVKLCIDPPNKTKAPI